MTLLGIKRINYSTVISLEAFCYFMEIDWQMAKRRNAKKEKAARNKINARKFRKSSSRYFKRGRRWSNYNNSNNNSNESNESFDKKSSEETKSNQPA